MEPELPTPAELISEFTQQDPRPHYYHGLRIGHQGQTPRSFRKITLSPTFPEVLVQIAHVAFEAKRLFGSPLTVEKTSYLVPVAAIGIPEALLNDDQYVESDPLPSSPAHDPQTTEAD